MSRSSPRSAQSIGMADVFKGILKAFVFADDHRDGRRLSGPLDARRRGGRRPFDDVRRRARDHPDLHIQLRPVVPPLRLGGMSENNRKIIARIEDATLAFGERVILKNCNLDIVDGAITCIIGLSGAGKSTILRLLDGLLLPSAGHVYVRGQRHLPHVGGAAQQRPAEDQPLVPVLGAARQPHGRGERRATAARTHAALGGRDPPHGHGRARQRRADPRLRQPSGRAFRRHAQTRGVRARHRDASRPAFSTTSRRPAWTPS